jgi:hypothetical protein
LYYYYIFLENPRKPALKKWATFFDPVGSRFQESISSRCRSVLASISLISPIGHLKSFLRNIKTDISFLINIIQEIPALIFIQISDFCFFTF